VTGRARRLALRISPVIAGLLAVVFAPAGHAQTPNWPTKPIRVVIGYAPGAAPDIVCRTVMGYLARHLGQQILIDNRPGSANMVAAQAAAHAPADGYNYYFATAVAPVTNKLTFKKLPYDPEKDFLPVAIVGTNPFFILVNPSVPATTLTELFALDKAHPGQLSFASEGPKNFSGLLGQFLNKLSGASILHVPYTVMPQGVQDTIAGRTQIVMLAVAAARPFIQGGQLRPLAISTARRIVGFEYVPPVAETFPGFDFYGWFSVFAPANTPAEPIQRMNRALDAVLKEPEMVQRLLEMGVTTEGASTPEGLTALVLAERKRWGQVFKDVGIEPE
jgi:tripartite-type tricarboxylate transporter receptor subunit TctC